uniref:Pseudouridine-metabolizing bifunctional protein C1861.05-like n=1 Tax=Phallusia mammillata TaxID=59560 RepID=A0A6F9DPT5_9ASCI|nr:pseudouridine-metabolizing bifunctional protein C1861.05-like [Phallusia mammillata]
MQRSLIVFRKFVCYHCQPRRQFQFESNATPLCVHKNVKKALNENRPVLALESTIITHGMPYPENLKTAIDVESIAWDHDVVPATIGVINGVVHVGMDKVHIETLATSSNSIKISKRDIAVACAKQLTGGTTVSATMLIAHWCGIDIFATGGVGGVHRKGEDTMDVSADLRQLGQTPVTVVSAGVKSILDIPRTLEYLETEGVTVATFGPTTDFPAFFTKTSGCQSPTNVKSVEEAVNLVQTHKNLKMESGVLIAVPIPDEEASVGEKINKAVEKAIMECRQHNIEGNAVTPFILDQVNKLTEGASLAANIVLIQNNVNIGAQIAKGLKNKPSAKRNQQTSNHTKAKRPVVIGGCNVDIVSKCTHEIMNGGPSNPAVVTQSFGGVGRNITETLWRLQSNPLMITAVGKDSYGEMMTKHLENMTKSICSTLQNHRTGVYNAIFNKHGEVHVAVEDSAVHRKIDKDFLQNYENDIKSAGMVCVDANIAESGIEYVSSICKRHAVPLLFEPTGELIAAKGYKAAQKHFNSITYITPNISELNQIYFAETGKDAPSHEGIEGLIKMCHTLLDSVLCILVTMGGNGVLCAQNKNGNKLFHHYTLNKQPKWAWLDQPTGNVSGAGDGFAAGFMHGLLRGCTTDQSVRIGLTVAQRNLRSESAVAEAVTPNDVEISKTCWDVKELTF